MLGYSIAITTTGQIGRYNIKKTFKGTVSRDLLSTFFSPSNNAPDLYRHAQQKIFMELFVFVIDSPVVNALGMIRGLYFGPKMIFIPPPFWKLYFLPLSQHVFLGLPSWPFCLNSSLFCNYFTPLFPFFSFLSPFFLFFLLHFPLFSLRLFIFSPKWHQLIFPPPGGEGGGVVGYFPIYRPLGVIRIP